MAIVLVVVDAEPGVVVDMAPRWPRWLRVPVVPVAVPVVVPVAVPVVVIESVVVVAPVDAGAMVSGVVVVVDVVALPGLIWALAADASRAAVAAIRIFMTCLLAGQRGGGAGLVGGLGAVTPGVASGAAPGASVPTRPSPIVPVDAPIGGVTPVAGIGKVGLPGTPPGGVVPIPGIVDGAVPAGA